ncbi:transposase [Treponema primitia]|uniref:transposase n=1 Tax=Treponema primitia TaxID=88058 RepID=UPI00398108DD
MANYKQTDKEQGLFLAINLGEQILPGTFEWTMSRFIDTEVDFTGFDEGYNNDEKGAPAYEPRILLKIVLYGYSQGVLSSRKLYGLCRYHIIMKALAENQEPFHTTIARFIVGNGKEIERIITEVLYFCNEQHLIGGKMLAVDGCKLPSGASKEWSGTKKELRKKREKIGKLVKKLISQHREEDGKNGGSGGTEEEEKYRERIRRYKEQMKKLDEFDREHEAHMGSRGQEIQSNVTDNESAKIQGPHGVIQGYNGIAAADSKNQIIVADTGYFSEDNLQAAKKKGVGVIIPDPQFRQRYEQMIAGTYGKYHEVARFDARDVRGVCDAGTMYQGEKQKIPDTVYTDT